MIKTRLKKSSVPFLLSLLVITAGFGVNAHGQEEPFLPGFDAPADQQSNQSLQPQFFDADPQAQANTSVPGTANPNQQRSQEEIEEGIRREAYDAALQGLLPLRPEEIREVLEHFDRTQEAVELPVYPNPKPEVAVETIPLDPGTKPATINVAYGHVTTINVLDSTGSPWPIQDISWAGNFEVIESGEDEGSHIIRISPQSEFAYGNMSMRLLTLKTPVILTLETSRDRVHYRFDAIIPEFGPFADAPIIDRGLTIQAGNETIASVLQGVVPETAERLSVAGVDGRTSAYRLNGATYVRTPLTLLSPGWSSSVSSADGMRVYEIQDTPVILLSDSGRMVRARLSDREDILQ